MSWTLFIDESGQDQKHSPYEVLAGLAIEDRQLWRLIRQLSDAQLHHFGMRLFEAYGKEAKAQKLLDRRTFRYATQLEPIPQHDRQQLARELLEDGTRVTRRHLTALAQAKLAYCEFALKLARSYGGQAFATMVPQSAPRPASSTSLRKDYAYLFERFFMFLNGAPDTPMGYLVFDELDKTASHVLLNQVGSYFIKTKNGRARSRLIIPEPFFVHSDLTTLVQVTDIIAYALSWGLRLPGMDSRPGWNSQLSSGLHSACSSGTKPRRAPPGAIRRSGICDRQRHRWPETKEGNANVAVAKASMRIYGQKCLERQDD